MRKIECPVCKSEIPPNKVGSKFSCPNCQKRLASNERIIFIYVLIIWILGEVPIRFALWSWFDSGWFRSILFALFSGCFGLTVRYLLIENCAEIKVLPDSV
jgi:hypothetical protein